MLKQLDFNDINKAHALVISEVPEMVTDEITFSLESLVPIDSLVISVKPHEIGTFVRELSSEVEYRKTITRTHGVFRKSDITVKSDSGNNLLNDIYVCLLLPRTLVNKNIAMLSNIYSQTIRLGIHIITVVQDDTDNRIIDEIDKYTFWKIFWDFSEITHK